MVFILRAQIIYIHIVLYIVTVRSAQPDLLLSFCFYSAGAEWIVPLQLPQCCEYLKSTWLQGRGSKSAPEIRQPIRYILFTLSEKRRERCGTRHSGKTLCVIGTCFVLPFCLKNSQRTQKEMMLPKPTVPRQPPRSHFINVPGISCTAAANVPLPDSSCKTQNIIT